MVNLLLQLKIIRSKAGAMDTSEAIRLLRANR